MLFLSCAATFILLLVAESSIMSMVFGPTSSMDYPDNDAYFGKMAKREALCRELQLLCAIAVATATTGVYCWWEHQSLVPALAAFATLEAMWLLTTMVMNRRKERTYSDAPSLALAVAAGALVGFFLTGAMAAAITPLILAGVLFAVVWCLLFPL